jgi:hypothetical protein
MNAGQQPGLTLDRVRLLKDRECRILLVLVAATLQDRTPAGAEEIAEWAGCSTATALRALKALSAPDCQIVVKTSYHDGWQLARGAFQNPLIFNNNMPGIDPEPFNTNPREERARAGVRSSKPDIQSRNSDTYSKQTLHPGANIASANIADERFAVVVVDPDQDLDPDQQQQPPQGETLQLQGLPGASSREDLVREACRQAGIAGDNQQMVARHPAVQPDWVQRTIRQVYLENALGLGSQHWDYPVGHAIHRLKSGIEPMPDAEMDALEAGEQQREERERRDALAREQPDRLDPEPDPEPAPRPAAAPALPHPSLALPIHGSMKPGQVWQAALGELQLQMTKPTFETWVKPCKVIAYKDGEFIIAVPRASIKDWLERKLLLSFKRSLAGILGRPVEVTFVMSNEE